jgi:polar amino acid transport system permease protein
MSVFDILLNYYPTLLGGLLVSLELFLSVAILGICFGVLFGAIGAKNPGAGLVVRIVSFLVAGVPLLVLLYWFYYPFQQLLGISASPFLTAVLTLTIVNIAAVAELVRGVLTDFPKQYITAAQMAGLSSGEIFKRVQFPMIFRQIIPSLLTTQLFILQCTLFASLISVQEIFRVAQNLNAVLYRPVEIYTALAVFFMLLLAPLYYLAYFLREKFTRDFSEN